LEAGFSVASDENDYLSSSNCSSNCSTISSLLSNIESETNQTPDITSQFIAVSPAFRKWATLVKDHTDPEFIALLMFMGLFECGQPTKLTPTNVSFSLLFKHFNKKN